MCRERRSHATKPPHRLYNDSKERSIISGLLCLSTYPRCSVCVCVRRSCMVAWSRCLSSSSRCTSSRVDDSSSRSDSFSRCSLDTHRHPPTHEHRTLIPIQRPHDHPRTKGSNRGLAARTRCCRERNPVLAVVGPRAFHPPILLPPVRPPPHCHHHHHCSSACQTETQPQTPQGAAIRHLGITLRRALLEFNRGSDESEAMAVDPMWVCTG
jgi:hypothetical protein